MRLRQVILPTDVSMNKKNNRGICPDILTNALAIISHFAKSLGNLLEIKVYGIIR